MSLFYNYGRASGKETLIKEGITNWCHNAKKGHKILVASLLGNYILEFKGKWKPKKAKIKIFQENIEELRKYKKALNKEESMREIKFRAWAVASRKMFYPDTDNGWEIKNGKIELPNTILMQFTGLKDKNGKEIWEGDVARKLYPLKSKEEYAKNPYKYEIVKWNKYQCSFSIGNNEWEVIGNIYENPELLNKEE